MLLSEAATNKFWSQAPATMATTTVVAFTLGMVILGIHVLHACPLSTGMCKQYGHACLGGHGKRSENKQNSRLMDIFLQDILNRPEQMSALATSDRRNLQDFWENTFDKNSENWNTDGDEGYTRQIFNRVK